MNKRLDEAIIVHYLIGGIAICGNMVGTPVNWEAGHKWSHDKDEVTCKDCKFNLACMEDNSGR